MYCTCWYNIKASCSCCRENQLKARSFSASIDICTTTFGFPKKHWIKVIKGSYLWTYVNKPLNQKTRWKNYQREITDDTQQTSTDNKCKCWITVNPLYVNSTPFNCDILTAIEKFSNQQQLNTILHSLQFIIRCRKKTLFSTCFL